ncbi:MAG: hypothetical protein AB7D51_03810 [Desulfovibrionaceae bacterium]
MRKFLLIGVAGAIVLLIGLVVTLIMSIDSIIEKAVNDYGPQVTLTNVHLDSANIGIFSGSGSLDGLTVGNPVNKGFKDRNLFDMENISIAIDTDSLTSDTIVIKDVTIKSPKIVYELKDFTDSNFDALLQNIEQSVGGGAKAEKAEESAEAAEPGQSKKIIIDNLLITGAEVTADMTNMPGSGLTIPLPDIHLTGIGREEGGASAAETAEQVVAAIYDSMEKAFAASGDFVMKGGQWVMDQGGAALDKAGEAAGDAVDGAGKAVDDAVKGIGKMFE